MLKGLIDRMLGRPRLPHRPSYEESRAVLERQSAGMRFQLAARTSVEPEILYYLADDPDPEIRRRVARNPATPALANRRLADDVDDDVRATLARKIGRLLPLLSHERNERNRELVLETLDRLARDALPRVRAVLAQQIRSSANAPRELVQRLARDAEAIVSAPILEYSPLLSDADLLEIVALSQVSDALAAVARRTHLSPAVCDAIIATLDIPATAALIANRGAEITQEAMDVILARAPEVEAWHEPLVGRPNLSPRVLQRIAGFVSSALIQRLAERHDIDPAFARELRLSTRLAIEEGALNGPPETERAAAEVDDALRRGVLDDRFVAAAAEAGQREATIRALAALSGAPDATVRRILESRSARAVTALVWKSGLNMRVSVAIQTALLHLRGNELLAARAGTDFPLQPGEMDTHLALFGLTTTPA